jgi:hypothetical protein
MPDFVTFLRELGYGEVLGRLNDSLTEAVASVENADGRTAKAPVAKIKLTLTLAKRSGAIEVGTDIDVKTPKITPAATIMYATPDNNLTRKDPRQTEMELRVVEATQRARIVDGG